MGLQIEAGKNMNAVHNTVVSVEKSRCGNPGKFADNRHFYPSSQAVETLLVLAVYVNIIYINA